jgi:hypothetical protein
MNLHWVRIIAMFGVAYWCLIPLTPSDASMLSGRDWQAFPPAAKRFYMRGLLDGYKSVDGAAQAAPFLPFPASLVAAARTCLYQQRMTDFYLALLVDRYLKTHPAAIRETLPTIAVTAMSEDCG